MLDSTHKVLEQAKVTWDSEQWWTMRGEDTDQEGAWGNFLRKVEIVSTGAWVTQMETFGKTHETYT